MCCNHISYYHGHYDITYHLRVMCNNRGRLEAQVNAQMTFLQLKLSTVYNTVSIFLAHFNILRVDFIFI